MDCYGGRWVRTGVYLWGWCGSLGAHACALTAKAFAWENTTLISLSFCFVFLPHKSIHKAQNRIGIAHTHSIISTTTTMMKQLTSDANQIKSIDARFHCSISLHESECARRMDAFNFSPSIVGRCMYIQSWNNQLIWWYSLCVSDADFIFKRFVMACSTHTRTFIDWRHTFYSRTAFGSITQRHLIILLFKFSVFCLISSKHND